jgi:hypothetical protein
MRTRALVALALGSLLALTGCGISASSPVDEGEGLVAGAQRQPVLQQAPNPDNATSSEDLVASYLKAAVGGGAEAITQVKAFLTRRAVNAWVDPPMPQNPVVIRLLGPITRSLPAADRTPFTVR